LREAQRMDFQLKDVLHKELEDVPEVADDAGRPRA
jgi:hypothetical protein